MENSAWSPSDALLDRVAIRVSGTVHAHGADDLDRFAGNIGSRSDGPRLFGKPQRYHGSWIAKCLKGSSTISAGEMSVSRALPDAPFSVSLIVNPMRTLGHLLDRYTFEEIEELPPAEFFACASPTTASTRSLDGRDNMVSDFLSLGGTVRATQVQRVARFLRLFETSLRVHVFHQLCPPDGDFEYSHDPSASVAWNDQIELRLDWGGLTVSQCEVCWEAHDRHALEKVHALAEEVLRAARAVSVSSHPLVAGASVERNLGALSIKLPLTPTGNIARVIYAKALDRLRVEVRYLKNLPDLVRGILPTDRGLVDWFDAIRAEAAPRVPWVELHELLRPADRPSIHALAELMEAVANVTEKAKSKRKTLFQQLIEHGAVTATNRDGHAPSEILERLRQRGVVEHVRLVRKDAAIGRRYRLTRRYASLTGCLPTE